MLSGEIMLRDYNEKGFHRNVYWLEKDNVDMRERLETLEAATKYQQEYIENLETRSQSLRTQMNKIKILMEQSSHAVDIENWIDEDNKIQDTIT